MNLHLTSATINAPDEDAGFTKHVAWGGSQAEAAASRREFAELGAKRKDISTHAIDVPTDKAGLMQFLNMLSNGTDVAAAHAKLTAK